MDLTSTLFALFQQERCHLVLPGSLVALLALRLTVVFSRAACMPAGGASEILSNPHLERSREREPAESPPPLTRYARVIFPGGVV